MEEKYPMILRDTGSTVQYGCVVFEKWVCYGCGSVCIVELKNPVNVLPRGCIYDAVGHKPKWRKFENETDPICAEMAAGPEDAMMDYYTTR